MSERPFMQLYVSDFIGDTLHLSTEQIGAYMLLLMAMWNAGGKLPAEESKLARIARLSVKKWKAVADDLMPFFEVDGDVIRHNRLTKELQKSEAKSQSRAAAGAEGGKAKALKDNAARMANAMPTPQHLPDTITREESSSLRSEDSAPAPRKRAHRMPDDFEPDLRVALDAGMTLSQAKAQVETMRDWSKSSPNGAKVDWPATWRSWVRRWAENQPHQRGRPPPTGSGNAMVDRLDELMNGMGQRDADERRTIEGSYEHGAHDRAPQAVQRLAAPQGRR